LVYFLGLIQSQTEVRVSIKLGGTVFYGLLDVSEGYLFYIERL
jgi:hypothetical protein